MHAPCGAWQGGAADCIPVIHACVLQAINGLSVRKKEHKYGCITAAILNLPPHERFKMENLLLLAIAQMKAVASCGGIMRVACGVDQEVLFGTATLHKSARMHVRTSTRWLTQCALSFYMHF